MYTVNNGLREWSLDSSAFERCLPDKRKTWGINHDIMFHAQQDEDKYIIQYLLKDKITDGVFLEVGGCDGVLYSNTKTLEDYFGFSGILIEPQPRYYNQLVQNRPNCENYNCAISSSKDSTFIGDNAEGGLVETLNTNVKDRFPWWKPYTVNNMKMSDILKNSRFKYIDFMFIDVEGGELELLKTIDFKFDIFCIIVEAHSDTPEKNKLVGDLLGMNGFTFKERQRGNEVYINHSYFRKGLFNFI
jgi:FkbM family methyltransferase